jgi:hypothetical protein
MMSYFDYVDWEHIVSRGVEKAVSLSFELFLEGKLKEDEVADFIKLAHDEFCKEIYLMGPVPMKEGYTQPTIELSFL